MMNFKKLAIVLAIVTVIAVPFAVSAHYEDISADKNTINIVVDATRVLTDNFLYNDTTYVQLRKIAEMLGKKVEWVESENCAYINDTETPEITDGIETVLTEETGSVLSVERNIITIYVNGEKVEADNFVYEGRTYVPLRKISEMLSKDVSWDQLTNTATIGLKKPSVFDGEVLGTINGMEYTNTLFDSYKTMHTAIGTFTEEDDADAVILEQIAQDYVLIQTALELGITAGVSFENEYEAGIANIIAQVGSKEEYEKLLASNGFTNELYYYFQMLNHLYAQLLESEKFAISTEEAKAIYEEKKDTVFVYDAVRAKHILIMPEADEDGNSTEKQWEAAKEMADNVYKLTKIDSNFDALVAQYNMDPGVASNPNGYTFIRGEMAIEFEEKCYSMDVGEISEPVKTTYGYHIIKLEERIPYFEYDADVEEYIKQTFSSERITNYITEAAQKAVIVKK